MQAASAAASGSRYRGESQPQQVKIKGKPFKITP